MKACLDIAQQLRGEKAITNAKRTLIHDHLDHCLEDAFMPTTVSLITRLANLKR
jgi:DNA-binding FrmR family transcriptional regulator